MEDDDDFTFPTVAAAGTGGRLGSGDVGDAVVVARMPLQLPVPDTAAAAAPLWPFAGSPKATAPPPSSCTAPVTKDDEEAPPSGSKNGRVEEHRAEEEEDEEDRRRRRVAADEERMDLLWAAATTTTTAPAPQPTRSSAGGHAEPPPPPKPKPKPEPDRAEAEDDKRRAAAVADAERMDKLWESFNEELLPRHAFSKAAATAGRATDPADRWYLCSHSDAESEGTTAASSPAERRGYGCAPTMLRASSRAGGAGQFCGSPRGGRRRGGGGRGAAAGWALLLRLFRRLFAVDKAQAAAASRSHASIYVP